MMDRSWESSMTDWLRLLRRIIAYFLVPAGGSLGVALIYKGLPVTGILAVAAATVSVVASFLSGMANVVAARVINRAVEIILEENRQKANRDFAETDEERVKSVNAIAAMLDERRSDQLLASIFLLLALAIYLGLGVFLNAELDTLTVCLLTGGIVLVNGAAIAFHYRFSHGLYGTNEYEAREIIGFILDHGDDIDFSAGLGARELDLTPEAERAIVAIWEGEKA